MVCNMIDIYDMHDLVDALTAALEAKSAYTCGHSGRVAELSLWMARRLNMSVELQELIHVGAHLHDIGKIGVPDLVLDKPAPLTRSEMELIKLHPVVGDQIVCKAKAFQSVADIVRHHHERMDGQGYPDGLKGAEISQEARIVAIADAVDAMLSPRPYRPALTVADTMGELKRCGGWHFDPVLVDVMLQYLAEEGKSYNVGKKRYAIS